MKYYKLVSPWDGYKDIKNVKIMFDFVNSKNVKIKNKCIKLEHKRLPFETKKSKQILLLIAFFVFRIESFDDILTKVT